ncbi:MAG: malto-oligosyltrehalose trehalohydrolase [Chloroflexota bacterium]|nr:malto-oligosyltrehalose trehalohydrolase [Chloroflexota bacterium]
MTERLGATLRDGGCHFVVWAPRPRIVALHRPGHADVPMERDGEGYARVHVDGMRAGDRYAYRLDGGHPRPDPASRWQPDGVHGLSAVVDASVFAWTHDGPVAPPLTDLVLYELHVGTFTAEGTFDQATRAFDGLRDLGVNALEPLPIGQFPGDRNWGYDGVQPFAVQESYGGPEAFRRFVDAAHGAGLGVVLDVVYNHLGPEGNYLAEFGPYFTDRHRTPWGAALNFDRPDSDHVRHYFLENALMWLHEYHVDGLRLDAVHAIQDSSAYPFLAELADVVHGAAVELGRRGYVIAESNLNDPRVIRPLAQGGWGHDAQWSDDFHHALHSALTGERNGYYADYGTLEHLATAYGRGFVYAGEHSTFRKGRYGARPDGVRGEQLVVSTQTHDQVGNRLQGERLASLVGFEELKLAAVAMLCGPFTPMLFMGEEHGEQAPFGFFTSHGDTELIGAVGRGRVYEFAAFDWHGEIPDPQSEATFQMSVLTPPERWTDEQRTLRRLHAELLRLRRTMPGLRDRSLDATLVRVEPAEVLVVRRLGPPDALLVLALAGDTEVDVAGTWRTVLDTASAEWSGPGSERPDVITDRMPVRGRSAVLLERGT